MKIGFIGMVAVCGFLIGCGSPSKEDICGECSADLKGACELVYDACNDDSDCLDKLEDAKPCG
jgi:hypothetical protein